MFRPAFKRNHGDEPTHLYGGIAIAALLASEVLVYVLRRRRDAALKLTKLYPNLVADRNTIESNTTRSAGVKLVLN